MNSLVEIKKNGIYTIIPRTSTYCLGDVKEFCEKYLNQKEKFSWKENCNFILEGGKEYKVILLNIIYNKYAILLSPYMPESDKISFLSPNIKVLAELYLVEENIKIHLSFVRFQEFLHEDL